MCLTGWFGYTKVTSRLLRVTVKGVVKVPQVSKEWTQVVAGKFTREEEQIIKEEAKSQDMTVSEYVRASVYMSLILDGNTKAMRLAGGLVAAKLAQRFGAVAGRRVPA